MKNIFLNNLGLKLLALFLAFITWFYIAVELQKGAAKEREVLYRMLPYKLTSKKIPIKLNLVGPPLKGYKVIYDKIVMTPSVCVMIGPRSLLDGLPAIYTEPIDISGYTKTFNEDVALVSPVKGIAMKERFVSVTIPVAKIED